MQAFKVECYFTFILMVEEIDDNSLIVVFLAFSQLSCVAQLIEDGACNAKVVGLILIGDQYENVCPHYCKSLWIKSVYLNVSRSCSNCGEIH